MLLDTNCMEGKVPTEIPGPACATERSNDDCCVNYLAADALHMLEASVLLAAQAANFTTEIPLEAFGILQHLLMKISVQLFCSGNRDCLTIAC